MNMRWFKHMTASADDEKIAQLMSKTGLEGYGFWWRVVEIVAGKVGGDNETSVTFPARKWGNLLELRPDKFRRLAETCRNCGLFELVLSENDITVNIPNILKFRDEWSKRKAGDSGETPQRLRIKEPDAEAERGEERKHTPGVSPKKHSGPAPLRKIACGENRRVRLTAEELEKLRKRYGDEDTRAAIRKLDLHIEAKGRDAYKSHYAALQNWVFRAVEEDRARLTRAGGGQADRPRAATQAQKQAQERERRALWLLEQRCREREAELEYDGARPAADAAAAHMPGGALPLGGI